MDTPTVVRTAQAVGLTSALFLSGTQFMTSYLSIHPLYDLPISTATKIFKGIYYDGMKAVVPLALISGASYLTSAYLDPASRTQTVLAALSVVGTMIFTVLFIAPTNARLIEICDMNSAAQAKISSKEVIDLLVDWRGKNYVRFVLGLVGGILGVVVFQQTLLRSQTMIKSARD